VYFCIISCIKGEPSIEEYYEMALEAKEHRESITEAIMKLSSSQQFLIPGRLVVVKSESVCLHHIWFCLYTLPHFLSVPFGSFFIYIVAVLYFATLNCYKKSIKSWLGTWDSRSSICISKDTINLKETNAFF